MTTKASKWRALRGAVGALSVLLVFAVVYPLYCDCTARVQTSTWLSVIRPSLDTIAYNAINQNSLALAGRGVTAPPATERATERQVEILDSGTVLMWGGDEGQLVVLTPRMADGKVSWRCTGGSSKATDSCRRFAYVGKPEDVDPK